MNNLDEFYDDCTFCGLPLSLLTIFLLVSAVMFALTARDRVADHGVKIIGLHHPLDGVTNPKYKLLHLIQLTFFFQKEESPSF
jgi:hypothetical protein